MSVFVKSDRSSNEKVFEEINFDASEMAAQGQTDVTITEEFVRKQVSSIVADEDLSKFVL